MNEPCPAKLVALASRLVDASGGVIRRYFRTATAVDDKADRSPVTAADREAEGLIRAILTQQRPEDGIWGEEHGSRNLDAEYVWVIDPIDGTKAFVTGRPTFGTLVALLHRGKPVLGIIDQPIIGDRWLGVTGRQTTFNGQPARTRACPWLGSAILSTTGPDLLPGEDLAAFQRVSAAARITVFGGDCYAYGLVASGFQDLVIESGLKLHDFAALVPIVSGAGGLITDWDGRPLDQTSTGRVLAAGDARLHAEVLTVLNRA